MSLDTVNGLFDDMELQTFEFEPELFTAIPLYQNEQEEATDTTTTPDSLPPMQYEAQDSNHSPYLRRQYVKVACQRCRIGHKSCSHTRPCQRCTDIGMSSSCCDDGGDQLTDVVKPLTRKSTSSRTRKSNFAPNVIVVDFMGTIIQVPYFQRATPHLIIVKQQKTNTPSHLPIPRLVRTFNQSSK